MLCRLISKGCRKTLGRRFSNVAEEKDLDLRCVTFRDLCPPDPWTLDSRCAVCFVLLLVLYCMGGQSSSRSSDVPRMLCCSGKELASLVSAFRRSGHLYARLDPLERTEGPWLGELEHGGRHDGTPEASTSGRTEAPDVRTARILSKMLPKVGLSAQ